MAIGAFRFVACKERSVYNIKRNRGRDGISHSHARGSLLRGLFCVLYLTCLKALPNISMISLAIRLSSDW